MKRLLIRFGAQVVAGIPVAGPLFWRILISGWFACQSAGLGAQEWHGPLQSRNQFPLFQMFLNPPPASPVPLPPRTFRAAPAADYSSIFINRDEGDWEVLMDMELLAVDFQFEYGLTRKVTVSFQPVFLHMQNGFLDSFLESYHDRLGVSNYGRESRPKDQFGYAVSFRGQNWVQGKADGFHIADSLVSLKYAFLGTTQRMPLDLALQYTLKLPVGDAENGFGSGKADHGIHLLSRTVINPVAVYFNCGYLFLSDPQTNGAAIQAKNAVNLFAGLEYRYSATLSLILQMNYISSPLQDGSFQPFSKGGLTLDTGFVYRLSKATGIEFVFGEDPAAGSVPDFTVHLRLSYTLP